MDDLIKRLEAADVKAKEVYGMDLPLLTEAAAALTEAQAEIERLRGALERARVWVGYAMLDGDRYAEADAKIVDEVLNTPKTASPE